MFRRDDMQLKGFTEKEFIKDVLSKYSKMAKKENFDDCIAIDLGKLLNMSSLPYLVYSIDHPSFIKRAVDHDLQYKFYGRWVTAITCADVLAMGATPKGFALDLSAPLETESTDVELIIQGILDVLNAYGVEYEGGNIDSNNLELVCFCWGVVDREKIIRRTGARVGDYIAVTGELGVGWADWILRKLDKFHLLPEETQKFFLEEFKIMPLAPHKAILEAASNGGITSGMDLSDGMIEFLYTISERNGLGARIDEEKLPVTKEMEEGAKILNVRPPLLALEAGYDTPLTHGYTIDPVQWRTIEAIFKKHDSKIYVIGEVTEERGVVLQTDSGKKQIPKFWDDQFQKKDTIKNWFSLIEKF